jgi:hypothetical protein
MLCGIGCGGRDTPTESTDTSRSAEHGTPASTIAATLACLGAIDRRAGYRHQGERAA